MTTVDYDPVRGMVSERAVYELECAARDALTMLEDAACYGTGSATCFCKEPDWRGHYHEECDVRKRDVAIARLKAALRRPQGEN